MVQLPRDGCEGSCFLFISHDRNDLVPLDVGVLRLCRADSRELSDTKIVLLYTFRFPFSSDRVAELACPPISMTPSTWFGITPVDSKSTVLDRRVALREVLSLPNFHEEIVSALCVLRGPMLAREFSDVMSVFEYTFRTTRS